MKRVSKGRYLAALGLVLVLVSAWQLARGADALQYVFPAPETINLDNLRAAADELTGSVSAWTVGGEKQSASLTSDSGGVAEARLVAAGEDWFRLYPRYLLTGRLLSPEELKYGGRLIVLDEDLALKLFGIAEPIDRTVALGEQNYRVVGVARHRREPGEYGLYSAYIPLPQAMRDKLPLDSLTVSAAPIAQSGASSAFASVMTAYAPGGDLYDLKKEALREGMLARLCLCAAIAYLLVALIRALSRYALGKFSAWREHLRHAYLRDLLGQIARSLLACLAGAAAIAGAGWALIGFALAPVYVFPEWIPPVLVEWTDISATFWNLATAAAKPAVRYTQERLYLSFWGTMMRWGLVSALLGLALGRFFKRDKPRPDAPCIK